MHCKIQHILYTIVLIMPLMGFAQKSLQFEGQILQSDNMQPVEMATIVLTECNNWQTSNENGRYHLKNIQPGKYTIQVSCLGFNKYEKEIQINENISNYTITLDVLSLSLNEVTVTASEDAIVSASKIEQAALQHIQSKSLEDVMQLVPGCITENPSLSTPGQLRIRMVGYENDGQVNTDSKNATDALGAAIIIDGTPVSNNSNLQLLSTSKSGTSTDIPSVAGRGIDLREISTNNIESVNVIRGIPSVEYGDLTSGAVIVKTKAGRTPFEAKVAIDPGSKLFYIGKGFLPGKKKGAINLSLDYTQSYPDIRKKYKGYERITSNIGYSNTLLNNTTPLSINFKVALFSTIDDKKTDAQLKTGEVITANKKGIRTNLHGQLRFKKNWFSGITYNFSASYAHQNDYERELKTITAGTMPLATSYKEGEHSARFLPSEYHSELTIDGKPYDVFAQIKTNASQTRKKTSNNIMMGIEWRLSGNNGNGRQFDINYPPTINSTSTLRPRSYKDVPALTTISLFIEDRIKIKYVNNQQLDARAGIRYSNTQASGLFNTDGAITFEPRINLKYQLVNDPHNSFLKNLSFRAGYGIAAKSPTLAHLYPDKAWFDASSLNYKDEKNPDGSLAVLTTQIVEDTSNPTLKPAYNRKHEAGIDFNICGITGIVTGYREKQTGGFSFNTVPYALIHREYSVTGNGKYPWFVENEGVFYTEENETIKASYTYDTSFVAYNMPQNDYVLIKKGIEYTLNPGKIDLLRTSFVINGAWMYTKTYDTQNKYSKILGSYQSKPFPYFALRPAGETTIRQRLNTNIRAIVHIPEIKTIISLTTQIIWIDKRQYRHEDQDGNSYVYVTQDKKKIDEDAYNYQADNVLKNVAPLGYLDKAGNYHDWNPETYNIQPYYQMVSTHSDFYYLDDTYPPAIQFNIKLTKEFSNHLNLAFTANNFLNTRPYHKSPRNSGYKQRNTPLYFGAELTLKF